MNPNKNGKVGILGIGNLLLMDEGFGVHMIRCLEEQYEFPESVQLMDVGTAGIYMAPVMESVSYLMVIDVVDLKADPGTIHIFSDKDIKNGCIPTKMSPHQLGLLEMLSLCKLRGQAPEKVEFICIVPEKLETGICLSPLLREKVPEVGRIICRKLREQNIFSEKNN
jgi:hydrogenase maturation protease